MSNERVWYEADLRVFWADGSMEDEVFSFALQDERQQPTERIRQRVQHLVDNGARRVEWSGGYRTKTE